MSAIKLNSSGGGSITISPASTASTLTLTAPAATGTIGIQGPAFAAANTTTQSGIVSGSYTKVAFNAEEFDTNNNYDPTTNYRFTPTVAGYYQVNFAAQIGMSVNVTLAFCVLYKNGSITNRYGSSLNSPNVYSNFLSTGSTIIFMNGTTDYLEVYAYGAGSGTATILSNTGNFSAFFVRPA